MNATSSPATNEHTAPLCDVCDTSPAVGAHGMCASCRGDFLLEVNASHATDPTSEDNKYVTPDQLARDIRSSVVYDQAPSPWLKDADIPRATRDASGANFTITTCTGQTFRVIVTEIG